MLSIDCDTICDEIAAGDVPLEDALAALSIARETDPTESHHAAHIRDAIRDNLNGEV